MKTCGVILPLVREWWGANKRAEAMSIINNDSVFDHGTNDNGIYTPMISR